MSAWIVSRKHIDYIVAAAIQAELISMSPDETGRMLWRECLASVAYRYPGDTGNGDRPGPVDFKDSDVDTYTWTETPCLPAARSPRRSVATATSHASTRAGTHRKPPR